MNMATSRELDKMSRNKLSKRYQNLLNLVYLQAQPTSDEEVYKIPRKVFVQIETELDFNVPEEKCKKQKLEEEIKRRYRKRDSYVFWKDFLDIANIANHVDAKEYLMKIFSKLDSARQYGSMTHAQYALETLQLAIDDVYGTDNLVLQQYKFTNPKLDKTKKKKAKKTNPQPLSANSDSCPF